MMLFFLTSSMSPLILDKRRNLIFWWIWHKSSYLPIYSNFTTQLCCRYRVSFRVWLSWTVHIVKKVHVTNKSAINTGLPAQTFLHKYVVGTLSVSGRDITNRYILSKKNIFVKFLGCTVEEKCVQIVNSVKTVIKLSLT